VQSNTTRPLIWMACQTKVDLTENVQGVAEGQVAYMVDMAKANSLEPIKRSSTIGHHDHLIYSVRVAVVRSGMA